MAPRTTAGIRSPAPVARPNIPPQDIVYDFSSRLYGCSALQPWQAGRQAGRDTRYRLFLNRRPDRTGRRRGPCRLMAAITTRSPRRDRASKSGPANPTMDAESRPKRRSSGLPVLRKSFGGERGGGAHLESSSAGRGGGLSFMAPGGVGVWNKGGITLRCRISSRRYQK